MGRRTGSLRAPLLDTTVEVQPVRTAETEQIGLAELVGASDLFSRRCGIKLRTRGASLSHCSSRSSSSLYTSIHTQTHNTPSTRTPPPLPLRSPFVPSREGEAASSTRCDSSGNARWLGHHRAARFRQLRIRVRGILLRQRRVRCGRSAQCGQVSRIWLMDSCTYRPALFYPCLVS